MQVAGLRAIAFKVRRASYLELDRRRADRSRQPRSSVSPAPSDGARGRMAADQNRRPSDHDHRADGYVRVAARTGLDLHDQRPERVAGDEKAALHKLRRALELAVLVLDGNHPVVSDRVERADEAVPPDLAQAREPWHLPADSG